MTSPRASTGNPGRATLGERRDDLYETPPEAVRALLRAEPFFDAERQIWEPAAGRGAIVNVLCHAGHYVHASDLVDYGSWDGEYGECEFGVDFLLETRAPIGCEAIVMNPPYKLADQFVRHAITLVPKVYALLRLAFLEGTRRSDLVDGTLSRVYVFRNRLPRMHRDGWTGSRATSTIAFGWFVFEQGHTGPVQLSRITWK